MKNALALGTFDGIHIAHKEVLNLPVDCKKIAVTFEKPPKMFLSGNYELIMSFEDKCQSLKSLGYDEIVDLDFFTIKDTEPEEFLSFLYENYNPTVISCGFNYRFGKNGKGDISLLKKFCQEKGIELNICKQVALEEQVISSSFVRDLLKSGEIEKANSLLLKPFSFSAEVIKGDRRGRTIGFPTINQKYPKDLVKIKFGVYKTKVLIDGKEFDGITNIGMRPTFESDYVISETHIKDFSGDLYGKTVTIVPYKFLREEKKFSNLNDLKNQIEKDIT